MKTVSSIHATAPTDITSILIEMFCSGNEVYDMDPLMEPMHIRELKKQLIEYPFTLGAPDNIIGQFKDGGVCVIINTRDSLVGNVVLYERPSRDTDPVLLTSPFYIMKESSGDIVSTFARSAIRYSNTLPGMRGIKITDDFLPA